MRLFFYVAVLGLTASAVAHVSTFIGINPQRVVPWIWVLHVMIFVVWIPVIVVTGHLVKKGNRKDFWKLAMQHAPTWMKGLCVVLLVYAFFNFFFTILVLNEEGTPSVINGKKVLHNHGTIIRELSDQEYETHEAYGVRTFSGHWMMFYAVGMTVLYPTIKDSDSSRSEVD